MVSREIARVVIDTNVIVSGLLFGGPPGDIVPLWQSKRIMPFACTEIIDEYVRVLAYPKFELTEEEIQYLLYLEILPCFEAVTIRPRKQTIVKPDPADDKFILCAQAAQADFVISGDQHLLARKSFQSVIILTPAEFLRL